MRTWGDARTAATARLRSAPDPHTAALDADVLLAHVLGVGKEALYAHPERELSAAEGHTFQELVERRSRGEPVAYLRGFKEFYGLRFQVDPRVLIPRPETEVLVDAARERIAGRPLLIVDVGTGSGAIAVATLDSSSSRSLVLPLNSLAQRCVSVDARISRAMIRTRVPERWTELSTMASTPSLRPISGIDGFVSLKRMADVREVTASE